MAHRTDNGKPLNRGFTLIELLVVMVIIASLLAIAVPRYFHSVEHSREVVLMQDLRVLRQAIDQFYGDHGHYPETLVTLQTDRYILKIPVDPFTKSDDTWIVMGHQSSEFPGVYDVKSGAEGVSSDGVAYADF